MGKTIGRVDFIVDFDGRSLPLQARKLGNQLGDNMGSAASERFLGKFSKIAQELLPEMEQAGRLGGHRISDAMENAIEARLSGLSQKIADAFLTPDGLTRFRKNFESADDAARDLRDGLQELHDTGNLNEDMWARFGGTLNNWLGQARKADAESERMRLSMSRLKEELYDTEQNSKRVAHAFPDLTKRIRESGDAADRASGEGGGGGGWKGLSHNLRQAIIIVAAVAAGASEISVLGSAAGAGLTILGSAAVTAGVGLGVLIAGLQGVKDKFDLIGERDKLLNILPKDLSKEQLARLDELQAKIAGFDDSIFAIQRLGASFVALQDQIEDALLRGLGPAIDTFNNTTIKALGEGLVGIAGALNVALGDLLARLSSDGAIQKINDIFTDMQGQIPFIVAAIGNLGSALADIIRISGPFVQDFVEGLANLTKKFQEFTSSVEGKNKIEEWFRNGARVVDSFSKVLGEAAKVLSNLVTPETVQDTVDMLDNLAGAMPFLQGLLEVVSKLDVFGLVAQLLNDVGNALTPLLDLLKPIAEIINTNLSSGFSALGGAIQFGLIGPLQILTPIFEGISLVAKGLSDYFQMFMDKLTPLGTSITDVGNKITANTQPAFQRLLDKILELLPTPGELQVIIDTQLAPAMDRFAKFMEQHGTDIVNFLVDAVISLIDFLKDLPETIDEIEFWALQFARIFKGPIGWVQNLIALIDRLNGKQITLPAGFSGSTHGFIPEAHATGGIINASRFVNSGNIAGEAGPEAIVPLSRALSQVDPSVRALSAIAQGKAAPAGGPTKVVDVGGVIIVEAGSARQTASAVLEKIMEDADT